VLTAFIGPRPKGRLALHRDDVATHNNLSNLYWGTHRQNMIDAVRNGRVWPSHKPETIKKMKKAAIKRWAK
jgi:hypothetical protein